MADAQRELTNAQSKTDSNRIATGTHAMLTIPAKLRDGISDGKSITAVGKSVPSTAATSFESDQFCCPTNESFATGRDQTAIVVGDVR